MEDPRYAEDPDLIHIIGLWPLWRDNRLDIHDLTLIELQMIQSFDSGFDKGVGERSKSSSPTPGNAIQMGNLPASLLERGKVSFSDMRSKSR